MLDMDVFGKMLTLQTQMFLLILIGAVLAKTGVVTDAGRKCISAVLIDLLVPCNIINSFLGGTGVSAEFMRNCLYAFAVCSAIQAAAIFGSPLLFRRLDRAKKNVLTYGMICSSSSFIGLPVVDVLYGSVGVMYTSIFQVPIRFTMWTSGLSLFTSVRRADALKKLAVHPCIVSIFLGLGLMAAPFELPGAALDTISGLSHCCVPMSMLMIGSILAGATVRSFFDPNVLWYCFLRLIAFPLLVWAVLYFVPVDPLIKSISVLMTGMPAGSTTSILAERYDCDSLFASRAVFVSAFFSVFTLPVLCVVL